MNIREPVVANQFYPGNPSMLKDMILSFFENKNIPDIKENVHALIVPHAGYTYSGKTAAYAFKQIQNKQYDSVIIIGPSHSAVFDGISVYPEGSFKTPLGNIEIDKNLTDKIISFDSHIIDATEPHLEEHSIEVMLPFLQVTLDNFKIVPICMGSYDFSTCNILADAILNAIGNTKKVLIIASSDFYHGHNYEECKESTTESAKLITYNNIEEFYNHFYKNSAACGGAPIVTTMLVEKKLQNNKISLLNLTNSGDITGVKTAYVVGYASFAITE
ncbi:MAG: AmmeMemoRadiSam system protein B [bacterium]|nr:AmmeMemoRadiSam system protein B [bacterium]